MAWIITIVIIFVLWIEFKLEKLNDRAIKMADLSAQAFNEIENRLINLESRVNELENTRR